MSNDWLSNVQPINNVHSNDNNEHDSITYTIPYSNIQNDPYPQYNTTQTRFTSPYISLGAIALDMLAAIDDYTEYYDNYEANLRLAERMGVVEVGIDNLDEVSTIVPQEQLSPDDICTICLDKILDKSEHVCVRKLICGHMYCDDCISQWLAKSKKCPVCNVDLEDKLNELEA
jgi:hypothetical protein